MSRIDEMVRELCPGGVVHRELGELAGYAKARVEGLEVTPANYTGVENLLQNTAGRIDAASVPSYGGLIEYRDGDVLIGNIRPYLKKAWLADQSGGTNGDVLVVRIAPEYRTQIQPRFLYLLLSSDAFFAYDMRWAKGAKMPRGDKSAILRYRIPVPPMEVQSEVVRMLGTFKMLEAELEAELEARRRQYAYYRDSLLSFPDLPGGAWMPMGEAVMNLDSQRRPVTRSDRRDGVFPYYGANGVQDFVDGYLFEGTFLLMGEDGSVATDSGAPILNWAVGKIWVNNHAHVLAQGSEKVRLRFLFHYLKTVDISPYVTGGTQRKLNQGNLNRIPVPVPSLEEQERIVAILDNFDSLTNDLTFGLPAEIVARRKQYEYYRDRLLTFEEAA